MMDTVPDSIQDISWLTSVTSMLGKIRKISIKFMKVSYRISFFSQWALKIHIYKHLTVIIKQYKSSAEHKLKKV